MTYDDCEAFEAQQAAARAGRLYARLRECEERLTVRPSALPDDELERLEARLDAVASRLRVMEEALMERETLRVSPIVRELGEIRRVAQAMSMRASTLEGTGDINRTEAS